MGGREGERDGTVQRRKAPKKTLGQGCGLVPHSAEGA